ncbi:hypothetical protein RUM44_004957 [Polyplax serrata]|uniref:Uncharacterized protein n=1 Tax=Polyplax serrata TaxID=468196 RepID=A0ABR1AX57_POLSC
MSMEGRIQLPGRSSSSNSSWTFSNSHDLPKPRKGRLCGIFLIGAALIVALSVIAIGGLAFYIGGYTMEKHQVSEYKAKENIGAKTQYSSIDASQKPVLRHPETTLKTMEDSSEATTTTENNQAVQIPAGTILGISKTMQQLSSGIQSRKDEEIIEATTDPVEMSTEYPFGTEEAVMSPSPTKDVELVPKDSIKYTRQNEETILGLDMFGMQNGHARPAYAQVEERVLTASTPFGSLFPPKRDYSDEPWKPIIPSYRDNIRVRPPYQEKMAEEPYEGIVEFDVDDGNAPITFSKDSFDKNLRITPEYVGTNNNFGSTKDATFGQVPSISSEIAAKFKDLIPPRVLENSGHLVVDDVLAVSTDPPTDITIIKSESASTISSTTMKEPQSSSNKAMPIEKFEINRNTESPVGIEQIMSSVSMLESNLKTEDVDGSAAEKTTPREATIKTVLKVAELVDPLQEALRTSEEPDSFTGRAEATTGSSEEVFDVTEIQKSSTSSTVAANSVTAEASTTTTSTTMMTTTTTTTKATTTSTSTTALPTTASTTVPTPVKAVGPQVNATVINPFLDDSRSSSSNFNFGLPDFPIIKQFHHLDSLLKSFSKPSGEGGTQVNKFVPRGEFWNDTSITRFPARTKQTTTKNYNSDDSVFVQVSTITPEKTTRRQMTPPPVVDRRPVMVRGDVQVVSGPVRQLPSSATTEIPKLITLLPVRSNVNMMRPLRPRPKSNVNGTFTVTSRRIAKMNSGFKTNDLVVNRTTSRQDEFVQEKNERVWVHYPSYKISATTTHKNEKLHIVTPEPKVEEVPAEKDKIFNFTGNLTSVPLYNTIESLLNSDHRRREGSVKEGVSPVRPSGSSDKKNTSEIVERIVKIMENIAIATGDSPEAIVKVNQTVVNKTSTASSGVRSTGESNGTQTTVPVKIFSSHYKLNQAGVPVLTKVLNRAPDLNGNDENKTKVDVSTATVPTQAVSATTAATTEAERTTARTNETGTTTESCLAATKRCNQVVDCPDAADEKNCTCADHLKVQQLHRKLCDGIVDCWDFTDEYNCEWCKDEFLCSNSKMCIKKSQICDGSNDCPFGDDERNCVTISPSRTEAGTFNYHSNGYLMVRKNGRWGKLCIDNFDSVSLRSKTGWKISDLGRSVCKALTFRDFDKVERMISVPNEGRSIGSPEKYYELAYQDASNGSHSQRESSLTFHETECNKKEVVKVTCTDLECGLRPQATSQWPSRRSRIVGGGNAGPGSWPWQAALYREGEFQCGGTLISEHWLISAGHCFFHHQNSYWVARLGTLRTTLFLPSPYEQLRHITEILLHPQYVDNGFINDISLLRMRDPVKLTDYVRPICLPKPQTSIIDGAICTIVGWGQLSEVGLVFPDTLQEVQLPILSTSECRKRTLFLSLYKITDDMFCAGYDRGGRDACLGDSGGPLMCTEADGKWTIYGITSNGYGCARSNRPGVYTKVSKYLDWINTQIAGRTEGSTPSKSLPDEDVVAKLLTKSFTNVKLNLNSIKSEKDACEGHRCPLGECLPKSKLCDGHIQCSDGSDEKDCW